MAAPTMVAQLTQPVEDAEFVEVVTPVVSPFAAARDALIADINATTTSVACQALLPRFGELPRDRAGVERAAAHAAYKAQIEKLGHAETMAAIDTKSQAVAS